MMNFKKYFKPFNLYKRIEKDNGFGGMKVSYSRLGVLQADLWLLNGDTKRIPSVAQNSTHKGICEIKEVIKFRADELYILELNGEKYEITFLDEYESKLVKTDYHVLYAKKSTEFDLSQGV